MIFCGSCGVGNDDAAYMCFSCGRKLQASTRALRDAPLTQAQAYAAPTGALASAPAYGFKCPYCQCAYAPAYFEKISTGGWFFMLIMLLICFPLFWIGLFMKEGYYRCRGCNMKIG